MPAYREEISGGPTMVYLILVVLFFTLWGGTSLAYRRRSSSDRT